MQTAVLRHAERTSASQAAGVNMDHGASGGKRDHEDMSHVMALVEAARKVRTITAQPCAQPHMGQMGSQCRRRKRLWPSSVGVSQDVTSVANAYRASREA